MKKLITLFLTLLIGHCAFAYSFMSGGIYYDITSGTGSTVGVTSTTSKYTGSVTIPSTVVYSAVTYDVTAIGGNAFYNCSGLTSVAIPSSVTSIGGFAFGNCTGLTSITILSSVTSIGSSAFGNCIGLTSIALPSSVTSIGDGAFSGCSGLTTINVDVDNQNYSSTDGVMFNKDRTTIVSYPGGKQARYTIPNSVTSIGSEAFSNCSGLTSVIIPNSVTSIGYSAFEGCSGLTTIDIPNSITSIGENAFSDCSGLTSVTIPNSVTSIRNGAFWGCSGLTSVTIPSSITSIEYYTFWNCTGLTSITIPSSVTSIGEYAFPYCTGLTSITIPTSVTSIGSGAFESCSGLTSITIPSSVISIEYSAFEGCTSLASIYAYSTTPVDLSNSPSVFGNVNKTTCTLYVPTGSKVAYQAAAQWRDFSNIVGVTTAVPTVNDSNFSLYLNSMDDAIRINGLKGGMLRMFDMNGRQLLSKQVAGDESVSVNSLPQGLYIVKLITAEGTVERKVMKK